MIKLILINLLVITSISTYSKVWNNTKEWNANEEIKYRKWVGSNALRTDIFSNPSSKWYGVKTDCSDAIFAFRIIYSSLNGLPFSIQDPSNTRGYLSNSTNSFDRFGARKIKKFIEFIGDMTDTIYLARVATFPLSPNRISSGDAYIYQKSQPGEYTRHAYLIKGVLPSKHFILYSSTVPKTVRTLDQYRGLPEIGFVAAPWGYKRFKWPSEVHLNTYQINPKRGVDRGQLYQIASRAGITNSLESIRRSMNPRPETITYKMQRLLSNACGALHTRKTVVEGAAIYLRRIGGRCMSKSENDAYSTPSRDSKIAHHLESARRFWFAALRNGQARNASIQIRQAMNFLTDTNVDSETWNRNPNHPWYIQLKKMCRISVRLENGGNFLVDLKSFYQRYFEEKASSDPHDPISLRWGVPGSERNKHACSTFEIGNL